MREVACVRGRMLAQVDFFGPEAYRSRPLLPLYVRYVRRRPWDVLAKRARPRLGGPRLAGLPGEATALRLRQRFLLSVEISGENGGRFTAGRIMLAQEAFEPKKPSG